MEHVRQTLPYARWVAAGVLLASAAAKLVVPVESAGDLVATLARWVGPPVEVALAVWLLAGVLPGAAAGVAGSAFVAFAAYAAWRVARESTACGCFGRLSIRPEFILLMTAVGAAALLLPLAVRRVGRPATLGLAALFAASSLAAGASAFVPANRPLPTRPDDGSAWASEVVRQTRAADPSLADSPQWRVWVVQHECPRCRSALSGVEIASALLDPAQQVVIAEVPPYADDRDRRTRFPAGVPVVRLEQVLPPCLPAVVTVTDGEVAGTMCPE